MRPVSYARINDVEAAVTLVGGDPGSAFLAGGTTKIDLLRLGLENSDRLVDINALPQVTVEELQDGTIRLGPLAWMSAVARTPIIKERFPAVSHALLLGASEQLRNMASMSGNLCQRTRCSYFRDAVSPCNKREPGTGCSAVEGLNRGHAILGTSKSCIATHPSDVAVALVAFDAVVHTVGLDGERAIPIGDFYLLAGDTPQIEHPLAHGELITAIDLPPLAERAIVRALHQALSGVAS
jgi:xanthine dehydrogenase YagS FAD-binding subunit